jgi:hypothetical protein
MLVSKSGKINYTVVVATVYLLNIFAEADVVLFLSLCCLLSDFAAGDVVPGRLKTPIGKNEPSSNQGDGNTGGWSADSRPVFLPTARNITVGPGDRAVLKCRVDHLGTRTVGFILHSLGAHLKN